MIGNKNIPEREGSFKRSFPFGRLGAFFFCFLLLACLSLHVRAGENLTFIRDAEIEHYLRKLATPVLIAAEVTPSTVQLAIIRDNAVNAFVAGGTNIFFYTGLLLKAETPEELLGVIAHETGHIAGGHLVRGTEAMRNASAQAIAAMLAGLAVTIASGRGDVAIGAISAGQTIAERTLLSFSRAQESSADAAALRFLDNMGESAKGFESFMEKLGRQDMLPLDRQEAYVRTHPLSQERVESIAHHVAQSRFADKKLDPTLSAQHERMKAKLLGFLNPETALLRYTDKDKRISARYARAIALYRTHKLDRALSLMDSLLSEEPANPFFIELKAQMLFENGRVAEAATLYEKAVALAPDSALLRTSYAHALLELKDKTKTDRAIQNLLESNRLEARNPEVWRFLAGAWARKGEDAKETSFQPLVSYALAEEALAKGEEKKAAEYAARALEKLPKNSPYWLRAQDIKVSADTARKD